MTAAENNSSAEFHLTFWKIRLIYRCLPPTPPSINPPFYQTLSLLVCLTEGETISQRPCRSIASIGQPQSGLFITSTLFFFFLFIPSSLHSPSLCSSGDSCAGVWPLWNQNKSYLFSLSLCVWMWAEWLWGCVSGVTRKLADMLAQVSDICPLCVP